MLHFDIVYLKLLILTVQSLLLKLPEQTAALPGSVVAQSLLVEDHTWVGLQQHLGLHGAGGGGDAAACPHNPRQEAGLHVCHQLQAVVAATTAPRTRRQARVL